MLTEGAEKIQKVEKWGLFELTLKGPAGGNPFVDVSLSAEFRKGGRVIAPEGFYDGNGIYRIRFMPDEEGVWKYRTKSNSKALNGKSGELLCTKALGGNRGPVHVRDRYHFGYGDGSAYWPIGTTCYGWPSKTLALRKMTVATLAKTGFNKMRMTVFPIRGSGAKKGPFPGVIGKWDFSRFDPAFFKNYEWCLGKLGDLGIEADLILFHPYDKGLYGFDSMPHEVNIRYLRYCIARFAAYRHVWWSLANEFDFVIAKKMSDWDSFGRTIMKYDPYKKLCSIHNGTEIYNHMKPWITHASIQNGSAVADFGRARIYRDCYRKPVVYDEVFYEGDDPRRWGHLSGQEMTHRCWQGYIAGTHVGHSESWRKGAKRVTSWLGSGGVLDGTSWPRLAFQRRIMEEGPQEGIGPTDNLHIGGIRGKYYIVYFGWKTPGRWKVELPKGIADGACCRVDIIDTWNMTITPLKGLIALSQKDGYSSVGERGETIRFPKRPFMALRINIVD